MSQRTGATRRPLIAGNWKMHKTSREGAAFVRALAQELGLGADGRIVGDGPDPGDREIVVAPPFTGLYEAVAAAAGTGIAVSAQDVFWEAEGPYT
ncbi:MAG TPA: triose-phosphate isomerase, partial [Thermoleophilia bacterium]|nr:triose-phosphate isomerase [Thermoleophilia bacterium]